jgi:HAMP domain-containing protein
MKLSTRFNLVLLTFFLLSAMITAGLSYWLLMESARQEVVRSAQLLMESALAVRGYTVDKIKPHMDPMLIQQFLPQTVPAFAATETINRLRKNYPDYTYKEAVLNPTNPRDLVSDWERRAVESFRDDATLKETSGYTKGERGTLYYVARPIKISNAACLACHSTPEAAPATMLTQYGEKGGFGWQHNETVGAQVVTVPVSVPEQRAMSVFTTFMSAIGAVFLVLFIVLNLMLKRSIVKPIEEVAQIADRISRGDFSVPEFAKNRKDEIGTLQQSFNRMRRSLDKAMRML